MPPALPAPDLLAPSLPPLADAPSLPLPLLPADDLPLLTGPAHHMLSLLSVPLFTRLQVWFAYTEHGA